MTSLPADGGERETPHEAVGEEVAIIAQEEPEQQQQQNPYNPFESDPNTPSPPENNHPIVASPSRQWSTSICGLFQDPSRRSDFCALTCCGVLLLDRNAYLLSLLEDDDMDNETTDQLEDELVVVGNMHNRRRRRRLVNWKHRCLFLFAVPLALMLVSWHLTEPSTATVVVLRLSFWCYILFWLYQARLHRAQLRQAILDKIHQDDEDPVNNINRESRMAQKDFRNATPICCSAFESDAINDANNNADSDGTTDEDADNNADVTTCLWNSLSNACCGFACGCWCQLCGMCAIGQESRELERLLRENNTSITSSEHHRYNIFQIDYITFQPFHEYYKKILEVRNRRVLEDWPAHLGALSDLSQHILKWFGAGVFGTAILAIAAEQLASFWISIVGTTIQAVIVLYVVHWKWGRFDISLDAVIKYTAAGFVLATFMSVVIEQLLMISLSPFAIIMVILDIAAVDTNGVPLDEWMRDPDNVQELARSHLGQAALVAFVFSFVVAAGTEELMKYMVYWMTETPDLLTLNELGLEADSNEDSKTRRARATTIAMVAVATGFAWSENIGYVHGQAKGGVWNEFAVFIVRSILPLHELCAAIQSIGIVRRDIEKDGSWKVGRSIFPAVFLHGLYDFVAIFGEILLAASKTDGDDDDGGASNSGDDSAKDDTISPLQLFQTVLMLTPVMVLGVWYYHYQAKLQRQRLETVEDYTFTEVRGTTSSLQVILEEETVEGSGEGLDAPLLEDARGP